MSLNKDKESELQIRQHDTVRICNKSKLSDKISLKCYTVNLIS